MGKSFVCFIKTFLVAAVLGGAALAQELPTPTGPVLLTIGGDISATNLNDTAVFDREMLLTLGTREIVTSTIWTEGQHRFLGVPLKAIADRLGIKDVPLKATAVNEYSIEIPFSDVAEDAALLALDLDGSPMSVRNKGPIWLIFPYDDDQRFRSETYHARSIWQLVRLDTAP